MQQNDETRDEREARERRTRELLAAYVDVRDRGVKLPGGLVLSSTQLETVIAKLSSELADLDRTGAL